MGIVWIQEWNTGNGTDWISFRYVSVFVWECSNGWSMKRMTNINFLLVLQKISLFVFGRCTCEMWMKSIHFYLNDLFSFCICICMRWNVLFFHLQCSYNVFVYISISMLCARKKLEIFDYCKFGLKFDCNCCQIVENK